MISRLFKPALLVAVATVFLAQARFRPLPPQPAPAPAPAADPAPSETPAAPAPLGPLKLYLMDGSQLSGKLSVTELNVDTKFGPLKVPIDSIRSFVPGLVSHPEFEKNLAGLIADLGADGFAEREKAQQALSKLGPQIASELRRELKTAEAEKQSRLQKLLEEFDATKEPDEDSDSSASSGEWSKDDVIVTDVFTIVGRITTPTFAVTSPYGTLQLKLGDLRRAQRDSAETEEMKKTIAVAGSLIATRSFETGLKVTKGDRITITATGAIQMTPWGNTSSTPDGGNFGMVQPGNMPGGSLIARIGTGNAFKVGSKLTFTADKSGILQFSIAIPAEYVSYQYPGEYQVKMKVTRK